MATLEKTVRSAAITVTVLFIGLSLFAIVGVWFVDRKATEISRKGFGLVGTAVGVVDAGVGRADDLIATSRTEVQQALPQACGSRARWKASRLASSLQQVQRTVVRRLPCSP